VCASILGTALYKSKDQQFSGKHFHNHEKKRIYEKNLFVESIYITMFLHNATLNFELYGCSFPPYNSQLTFPFERLPFAPCFCKMIFKRQRSSLWE
jgi:hypothetical protein